MSSPLRFINGGKPKKMKLGSFGRERDLEMLDQRVNDQGLRKKYRDQINAAHDLNDGCGSVDAFLEATRGAVFLTTQRERDEPLLMLIRVARYYPECLKIWDELASSSEWQNRLCVAGRLYHDIPEPYSDKLFDDLRADKSAKVSRLAIDRYKHRLDEHGEIKFDLHNPGLFDD